MASALAGVNVDACPDHACSPPAGHASPCGGDGVCHPEGEEYTCLCPLGWAGVTCEKRVEVGQEGGGLGVPSFGGDGFLHYASEEMAKK